MTASIDPEYLAPLLRIIRDQSLEDDIKLLASESTSPEKLLATVKGTKLAALLPQAPSLKDVEKTGWRYYSNILVKIAGLGEVYPEIYAAYSLPLIARDVSRILFRLLNGEEIDTSELTATDHPLVARVVDVGREYGFRQAARVLALSGMETLASFLYSARPDPKMLDLYVDLELLRVFAKAREKYEGEPGLEHLCFRLDAYTTRAAMNAAILGQHASREVRRSVAACLIDESRLIEALEEQNPDRIIQAIQVSPYMQRGAKFETYESAFHAIRKYSRTRLMRGLAYDPSSPGHAVTVLELLLLDAEDITVLTSLAQAEASKEVMAELLSITI